MKSNIKSEILDWARSIYKCDEKAFVKKEFTTERTLNRRGVLWLGQTCNLRCFFCYFTNKINDKDHPEHKFMSLEKAKEICYKLRTVYGNEYVDIQGGEPTIYPYIYELIEYCNSIGLKPSLITNAIVLADEEKCRKYKESGISDFLVSTHALREAFDQIVGLKGGSERQLKGLFNIQKLNIPFRLNCTLTEQALTQIPELSQMAIETGARVVNFIVFNPFADQQGVSREGVPRYSTIRKSISKYIDLLESEGVEVNVRYLPLCMLKSKHRKNIYNFQQLPYDQHEWDYNSWTWTTRFNQRSSSDELDETIPILLYDVPDYNGVDFGRASEHGTKEHYMREIDIKEHLIRLFSSGLPKEVIYRQNARLRAEKHCGYVYSQKCSQCSVKSICDGLHSDYAQTFGTDEVKPIKLSKTVDNPKHYISKQQKIISS